MTRTLLHVSRAAALALCAFVATQAHAMNMPEVKMNVPFDFVVSGKTLPAGEYSVIHANFPNGAPTFVMRSTRTRTGVYLMMSQRAIADPALNSAQAVFACRAGDCFLREIKIPGSDIFIAPIPNHTPSQKEKLISLNLVR